MPKVLLHHLQVHAMTMLLINKIFATPKLENSLSKHLPSGKFRRSLQKRLHLPLPHISSKKKIQINSQKKKRRNNDNNCSFRFLQKNKRLQFNYYAPFTDV